jgi:DNA invertase Pin-like site-specific DNA recombinase
LKKVTKIAQNSADFNSQQKLRVAAYCRVSTDSDEQLVSLEAQIKHYESYINANPEWEFAGLYYDEGITGTKKEKRPELLRMIADCEDRKIDLIVTKSISRFARNTTDCLELVRRLIDLGIFIYFEKENINTGSMESELMLSILSGLAESESVSISENNKWSIKRRFKNGTYKISYPPYGYDVVDGKLIVNESQTEIVRFIFSEILSGRGTQKIANELNKQNVPPKKMLSLDFNNYFRDGQ